MRPLPKIVAVVLILVAVGVSGRTTYIAGTKFITAKEKQFDEKIALLQRQIAALGEAVEKVTGESVRTALSLQEIQNRQDIKTKSQSELLTDAVAKAAPAVVSIVISKDVPQLEIVYQNPFGNDPFFGDFDFKVPVYRQKGTINKKVGGGTGFLITQNGYIVTNRHVVLDTEATYTVLLADGTQKPAKVIYKDKGNDVALIKIEGSNYKTITIGDSDSVKLGEAVVAIGNALGEYNNSVSVGIISGLNRSFEAPDATGRIEKLTGVFQTDAAINPGNSGGPLVNMQGQAIGINVATVVGSSNISFSIPVNGVKSILKKELGL